MSEAGLSSERGPVRSLSLLSGGLDSQLSICVLKSQGIRIQAIVFETPFFGAKRARRAAEALGVPVREMDFTSDIIDILQDPKHGFGSNMNPCIDCHATMLKRAGEIMKEGPYDFLATGEVLGQRPMSQNMRAMQTVAKESGCDGYVLRPLSAGLLPETEPEHLGWVDREKLLSIRGRSRETQLRLAEAYGLKDFPSPAGGCRLTDPNFSVRLRDLMRNEGISGVRSLRLLRVGRHFRLSDSIKLIVGRHQDDNLVLEGSAELYDLVLRLEDVPGPTAILPFTAHEEQIQLAAAICARYGDCPDSSAAKVRVKSASGIRHIETKPADPKEIEKLRI